MRSGASQSLAHIALIVRDYDDAIAWFTENLGFTLSAETMSQSGTSSALLRD
ncbi:MAG TPA: VOC family protein [Xanthobacteraceae bacterium]